MRDVEQITALDLCQHRHDQSARLERGGDADVDVIEDLERTVSPATVDFGHDANGLDGCNQKISREGKLRAAAFDAAAMLLTMRDDRAQVHLEYAGDMWRGTDTLHHMLGDPCPYRRVRHVVATF